MNKKTGRFRVLAAMLMSVVLSASGQTAAPPPPPSSPPIEGFFRAPLFSGPRLSPDGRHLAAIVNQKGNSLDLAVLDIENPGNSKIVAALIEADINSVHWVNNDRLVFDARERISGEGRAVARGLWAVDRDGSNLKPWISPTWVSGGATQQKRTLNWYWSLFSTLDDGSDDVILQQYVIDKTGRVTGLLLARLNTRTGERRFLTEGAPDRGLSWLLDRQGQPAFVTTFDEKAGYIIYRRQPGSSGPAAIWQPWESGDIIEGQQRIPLWVGTHQQLLMLKSAPDGTRALFRSSDTEPASKPEALLQLQGHDLRPQLVIDPESERLLGVHYLTEGPGTTWFDPLLRGAQQEVDALLPDSVNRLDCRRCLESPLMLVTAQSDRSPPTYLLYSRSTKQLTVLARARPWIKPEQMGRVQVTRFAARDGLGIPVQVTVPPGPKTGPRPTVMLVHGGPWVRGNHWTWDAEAQILASRGYVVVEPEFRGSQGYGFKHFRAGWQQWGLAMQDDVADATRWAIQQGLADPKRICIAGSSYGGYAAMMGLARDGDLYQCAVNWVGVTDLDLLFSRHWSDTGEEAARYRLPVLIGDPATDAQRLRDSSPIHLAERIKKPVLMAYGGLDQRVQIKHGDELRAALVKAGNEPEWIVYSDEGHGWRKPKNNVDFWTKVDNFLDRHIGNGASR